MAENFNEWVKNRAEEEQGEEFPPELLDLFQFGLVLDVNWNQDIYECIGAWTDSLQQELEYWNKWLEDWDEEIFAHTLKECFEKGFIKVYSKQESEWGPLD